MEDGRNPGIRKSLFPRFGSKNSLKLNSAVKVLPVVASPMAQHQPTAPYPVSPVTQPQHTTAACQRARPSPDSHACNAFRATSQFWEIFRVHFESSWRAVSVHPSCLCYNGCQMQSLRIHVAFVRQQLSFSKYPTRSMNMSNTCRQTRAGR